MPRSLRSSNAIVSKRSTIPRLTLCSQSRRAFASRSFARAKRRTAAIRAGSLPFSGRPAASFTVTASSARACRSTSAWRCEPGRRFAIVVPSESAASTRTPRSTPGRLARKRQGCRLAVRFKDSVPTAVLRHDEDAAVILRHRAPLAQPDLPDAGHTHALLLGIELRRTVAVRELQLIPAPSRLEPRIARLVTGLEPPEEGGKGQVQPVQHRVLALAVDGRKTRVNRSKLRQFGVLLLARVPLPARGPRVAALLQERVVEFARRPQHLDQGSLLSAGRIQPHLVQPSQLPRKSTLRRRHRLRIAAAWATSVAHRIRDSTPTARKTRPWQRRAALSLRTAAPHR